MNNAVAIQGVDNEIVLLLEECPELDPGGKIYKSDGFDGETLTTLIVSLAQVTVPAVAAVLAAKIASRRSIVVKYRGIEVSADTEREALEIIKTLTNEQEGVRSVD